MEIGERIKESRKNAGMTQTQLAEKSGVAAISIHQYEAGKRRPQLEQLLRLAAALNVDVNWLMNGQTLEQRDQAMKDYVARRFTEAELDKRLRDSYGTLTLEGKGKAVDSVEIIAGNPRYRAETAPESTPAPTEGQSTTPPPDAPETTSEGE